jgi:hypothetical protein
MLDPNSRVCRNLLNVAWGAAAPPASGTVALKLARISAASTRNWPPPSHVSSCLLERWGSSVSKHMLIADSQVRGIEAQKWWESGRAMKTFEAEVLKAVKQ